jgi:hypothetical protein
VANSADIGAGDERDLVKREALEKASEEAARIAWPPPKDWREEMRVLRKRREEE